MKLKKFKSLLPKMLCLFVAALLAILLYVYVSTLNPISGELRLQGLKGEVTLVRDQYGIAHITALESDLDAYFALAYAHSQDRFWQMEFQRHVEQGSLSELFGKATIETDSFLRTVGFYHAAESAWPALDAKTKATVQAYTDGVNAFLKTGHLPLQFKILGYQPKPWTVIDTIAWQKMIAFDLKNDYNLQWSNQVLLNKVGLQQFRAIRQDLTALSPTTLSANDLQQSGFKLAAKTPVLAPEPHTSHDTLTRSNSSLELKGLSLNSTGLGSNAWVIDGSKTVSGKPILANDPHLRLGLPGTWYLAELRGPTLHVVGATMPGLPSVLIGHNDSIAWGITSAEVEVMDLYTHPADVQLSTREETLAVKGQPATKITIRITDQGPVINPWLDPKPSDKVTPISLKWTGLLPGDTSVQAFVQLNYAQNWDDFQSALHNLRAPSLNIFYADTHGNMGYQLAGLIPLRDKSSEEHTDYLPLDAVKPNLWKGYIKHLPFAYNPAPHQIISANNKIVPDSYPHVLTRYWEDPGYRATRIQKVLSQPKLLSLSDMQALQLDTFSELWFTLKPFLLNAKASDAISAKGLSLLREWDGHAELDSIGATVFAYWYNTMTQKMNAPLNISYSVNEASFISQQISTNGTYCRFGHSSCRDFLSTTLQQAMLQLQKDYGRTETQWRWGLVHQIHLKEAGLGEVPYLGQIWNRTIASPGAESTVNVGGMRLPNLNQVYGANFRQIIDLSNMENSLYAMATGQSDNPFSSHYGDLTKLWQQGKYLSFNQVAGTDPKLRLLPNS